MKQPNGLVLSTFLFWVPATLAVFLVNSFALPPAVPRVAQPDPLFGTFNAAMVIAAIPWFLRPLYDPLERRWSTAPDRLGRAFSLGALRVLVPHLARFAIGFLAFFVYVGPLSIVPHQWIRHMMESTTPWTWLGVGLFFGLLHRGWRAGLTAAAVTALYWFWLHPAAMATLNAALPQGQMRLLTFTLIFGVASGVVTAVADLLSRRLGRGDA